MPRPNWSILLTLVLVALVPAFLLLGLINGLHLVRAYVIVQRAAREGARYAVSGGPLVDGQPWALPVESIPGPDNDRVDFIKARALEFTQGLKVDVYATGSHDAYMAQRTTPHALGVTVWGQTFEGGDLIMVPDHAGEQGLDTVVAVYYNVTALDPIYAAILPDGYAHVSGGQQKQNGAIPRPPLVESRNQHDR